MKKSIEARIERGLICFYDPQGLLFFITLNGHNHLCETEEDEKERIRLTYGFIDKPGTDMECLTKSNVGDYNVISLDINLNTPEIIGTLNTTTIPTYIHLLAIAYDKAIETMKTFDWLNLPIERRRDIEQRFHDIPIKEYLECIQENEDIVRNLQMYVQVLLKQNTVITSNTTLH